METNNHFKKVASLKSQTSKASFNKMKNLIFNVAAAGALLFSQGVNAQINLEHTFDGNVSYPGNSYVQFAIDFYTYTNTATNEVRLYNEDYSLYKTVVVTPPEGYSFGSASLFSKNVFTTDNKIVFLVNFTNIGVVSTNSYSALRLYDENGTMVKDFGYADAASPTVHITSNNEYRLSVVHYILPLPYTSRTEIYSLPGTVPVTGGTGGIGLRSTSQVEKIVSPYPNPANTTITLPYKLKQGETSDMRIYNTNGQLIETKQIDFVFDKIMLNVSGYSKGIYFYEVNGESNKFIVN